MVNESFRAASFSRGTLHIQRLTKARCFAFMSRLRIPRATSAAHPCRYTVHEHLNLLN